MSYTENANGNLTACGRSTTLSYNQANRRDGEPVRLRWGWKSGLAYTVDTSGAVPVLHTDALSSVRAITDGTGSITKTFQTDEFGIPLLTQGTSPEPFRYTGQERDAESGYYNLRARYYVPALGRFVSRDRVFGSPTSPPSLNRYSYAASNPVNLSDPSVECWW